MTEIVAPFQQFFDTSGAPLANGAIYIGIANLDAETNPIAVFWDEALTIPAAQPIRTLNGYPVRNGAPARLYANANNYSITVRNAQGRIMYSLLDTTAASLLSDFQQQLASSSGSSLVGFGQAGSSFFRTVQDKNRDFVSVKDFGAIGNGTADDTTAIQAAIDSLSATGGAAFFPPGTYIISSPIRLRANVTLWSTLYAATIKQKDSANLTTLIDFATNTATGAQLTGLVIDGNKANNGNNITTERFALFVYDTDDVKIENCEIKNCCGHGIYVRNGKRVRVQSNTIRDSLMYGVYVNNALPNEQNAPIIENNTFLLVSWHNILISQSRSARIINNYIFAQRTIGQFVTVSGNTASLVSGPDFSSIQPGNFLIYDGGIEALILSRDSNTQLTLQGTPGNRTNTAAATGAADLISVGDSASTIVAENVIVGGASLGISLYSTAGKNHINTQVCNNLTESTGSAGFSVQTAGASSAVREVSFTDNTAIDSGLNGAASDSNTLTGLYVSGTSNNIAVTGNRFFAYNATMSGMNILTPGGIVRAANNIGVGVTTTIQNGATISLSAGWGAGAAVSDIVVTEDAVSFLVTTSAAAPSPTPNITVTHRVMPVRAKIPSCQNVATSNVLLSMLTYFPDGASTSLFVVNGTPSASTTYRFVVRL